MASQGPSEAAPAVADSGSSGDIVDLDGPIPMDLQPKTPKPAREHKGMSPVWGATIGTGVAAAAAFGLSAGIRSSFDQQPTHLKYDVTNGAFYSSVGLLGVTAGLAITGMVISF